MNEQITFDIQETPHDILGILRTVKMTPSGVISLRNTFEVQGRGASMLRNSEFTLKINSHNKQRPFGVKLTDVNTGLEMETRWMSPGQFEELVDVSTVVFIHREVRGENI